MRALTIMLAVLFCILNLTSCKQDNSSQITVGIIEPLEHKAMDEIVAGFTEKLHAIYKQPIVIKVANSQNDANLQRAIIQKMRDAHYTIILPIGIDASQMTLSMVRNKPVVSLASDITDIDRKKLNPCNVAVVHDEIPSTQLLGFIHQVYPDLTELTLIHSSANKVFPEVNDAIAAGKKYGITIKQLMVSTLPELYSAAQALSPKTQGIFILKDHLIVSGIGTLAKTAEQRHIPLITSDQGSVQDGAGFAVGVHEREIGVEGAKLAAAILSNKSACNLPIAAMNNLTVFINKKALEKEFQSIGPIIDAAKKSNYTIDFADLAKG